jgi:hypothetical protein
MMIEHLLKIAKDPEQIDNYELTMLLRECADRMEADRDMINVLREQNKAIHDMYREALDRLDRLYEEIDRLLAVVKPPQS